MPHLIEHTMGLKIEMNLGDEFTIIQLNRELEKHNEAVANKISYALSIGGSGGELEK
jgi:hypothetical protein